MKTITVSNQKGGVAKTTTSLNLAVDLAQLGNKVLLIDLDSQGNSTRVLLENIDERFEKNTNNLLDSVLKSRAMLEIDEDIVKNNIAKTKYKNVELIPSVTTLGTKEVQFLTSQILGKESFIKKTLEVVFDEYDYVVLDCPPNLNILTLNALVSADLVMIPTDLESFGLDGTESTVEYAKELQLNYKVLITKFSDQIAERELWERNDYLKENNFNTRIRFQKKYINEQYLKDNQLVVERENKDNKVGKEYNKLTKEVIELLKEVESNE